MGALPRHQAIVDKLPRLQLGELLHEPIVGFAALGVIWYSLVSKIRLPGGAPETA